MAIVFRPVFLLVVGILLLEVWWLSASNGAVRSKLPRNVGEALFPGLSPQARRIAPIASLGLGFGVFLTLRTFVADGPSIACAVAAAVLGPRFLGATKKGGDGVKTAHEIVEAAETAAAASYTIRDALESLRSGDGETAEIAREVLADAGHRVSVPAALKMAGERRGPIVRRTLRMLSAYVSRGHWGPEAVESLRQIRETVEKQRRLTDSIRLATSEVRSLRMAIMFVMPAMSILLFLNNTSMMLDYVRTPVGLAAMIGCSILYATAIVVSRWLIPDWGN